jgi:serine/threonine protein kinase
MTGDITSKLPKEAATALELFPEFQISSFNDSGANGYVLIGRHSVLKKSVAIKIYFHDENEINQEPAIISKINHENVLKVFDARKVEKNCSYFLMPAASDGDLANFLNTYHLSLPLAHKLLCQLLSGISALHGTPNLLVHRDLKPENLLIHDDTIVIADFGSVRRIEHMTQKAPASKHSILYRPPEAFGESGFFNFSSDIYQAGLIGFLLFGGKLSNDLLSYMNSKEIDNPSGVAGSFEKSRYVDSCIEKRIRSDKLVNLTDLPFYVPSGIKRVIKSAISPIEKRYQNVSDFLAEMSRLRGKLPDWITHEGGFILNNWKGVDYFVHPEELTVMKRKTGNNTFRTDNSYSGTNIDQIHNTMKERLGLP